MAAGNHNAVIDSSIAQRWLARMKPLGTSFVTRIVGFGPEVGIESATDAIDALQSELRSVRSVYDDALGQVVLPSLGPPRVVRLERGGDERARAFVFGLQGQAIRDACTRSGWRFVVVDDPFRSRLLVVMAAAHELSDRAGMRGVAARLVERLGAELPAAVNDDLEEFVAWEAAQAARTAEATVDYWRDRLAHVPPPLPAPRPAGGGEGERRAMSVPLEPDVAEALAAFSARHGANPALFAVEALRSVLAPESALAARVMVNHRVLPTHRTLVTGASAPKLVVVENPPVDAVEFVERFATEQIRVARHRTIEPNAYAAVVSAERERRGQVLAAPIALDLDDQSAVASVSLEGGEAAYDAPTSLPRTPGFTPGDTITLRVRSSNDRLERIMVEFGGGFADDKLLLGAADGMGRRLRAVSGQLSA